MLKWDYAFKYTKTSWWIDHAVICAFVVICLLIRCIISQPTSYEKYVNEFRLHPLTYMTFVLIIRLKWINIILLDFRYYISDNYYCRCDIVESDECNTIMEQKCETVPKIQCDSTEKAACTTIQVIILIAF